MAKLSIDAKDRIFSPNYDIPLEYCWPGSLVIYWYDTTSEKVGERVAGYARFIEAYIAKRAKQEDDMKKAALTLINRSWMGKMIDAFSLDTVKGWQTNDMSVVPQPGGLQLESKIIIAKTAGFNPWAQLPRPDSKQVFNQAYIDSLQAKLHMAPQ
jgi:hypothetical protein